jgi:hypothetical protein
MKVGRDFVYQAVWGNYQKHCICKAWAKSVASENNPNFYKVMLLPGMDKVELRAALPSPGGHPYLADS